MGIGMEFVLHLPDAGFGWLTAVAWLWRAQRSNLLQQHWTAFFVLYEHVQEVQAFVDCFPSAVVHTKTACWLLVLLFGSMNARRVATSLKHLSTAGPFMCWTLWWQ